MVELFVIGVPEGTTQIKILEKLRANGLSTGNPDGMGFEDEWPDDIRQQGASSLRLVAWSSLQ